MYCILNSISTLSLSTEKCIHKLYVNCRLWCQKQVPRACISNYITQLHVGCNCLCKSYIPASGAKVLIFLWNNSAYKISSRIILQFDGYITLMRSSGKHHETIARSKFIVFGQVLAHSGTMFPVIPRKTWIQVSYFVNRCRYSGVMFQAIPGKNHILGQHEVFPHWNHHIIPLMKMGTVFVFVQNLLKWMKLALGDLHVFLDIMKAIRGPSQ